MIDAIVLVSFLAIFIVCQLILKRLDSYQTRYNLLLASFLADIRDMTIAFPELQITIESPSGGTMFVLLEGKNIEYEKDYVDYECRIFDDFINYPHVDYCIMDMDEYCHHFDASKEMIRFTGENFLTKN